MGETILVIEDEPIIALDLKNILIGMGYAVPKLAATYDQAVQSAQEIEPELMLVDINLKGSRDGIQAAQHIARPSIFLTSSSDVSTIDRAKSARPFGYLVKPVNTGMLRAAIEIALERVRLDQRLVEREQKVNQLNADLNEANDRLSIEKQNLQMALVQLGSINDQLEQRVSRRTQSLAETNSALQKAIEKLEKTRNELITSEKLASLGAMVAGISHELNTPIGNIVTLISLMQANYGELIERLNDPRPNRRLIRELLDKGSQMAYVASTCVERATTLVGSFKQVAAQQTAEMRRSFDLATVVREAVSVFQEAGYPPQLSVTVHVRIPEGIVCDSFPVPLSQVLAGLLDNAVVHGFEGRAKGCIEITAQRQGGVIMLCVTDDGIGMAQNILAHVFDPFFTTKFGKGGSGLGLTLCYRIVTSVLNGQISAESTPGSGTRINLTFQTVAPFKL